MNDPLFIDLRNVYRRELIARHGFRYVSIGRPDEDITAALSTAAE
jgi:UDPglucose 6-dehydrogenase